MTQSEIMNEVFEIHNCEFDLRRLAVSESCSHVKTPREHWKVLTLSVHGRPNEKAPLNWRAVVSLRTLPLKVQIDPLQGEPFGIADLYANSIIRTLTYLLNNCQISIERTPNDNTHRQS